MDHRITNKSAKELETGNTIATVALFLAVAIHGGLMPFTHENTYDAFIHMFFADHYDRSWFDPWDPRWYTGFNTTSYPPGTHMVMAGLYQFLPLRAAFVVTMTIGLGLLTVGAYRFSLLWVAPRAAGFASLFLVFSSAIAETIHLFGQLPTIFSLGLFLNGLPHIFRWILSGGLFEFIKATVYIAATAAAHHVTPIFGGVFFVLPIGVYALFVRYRHFGKLGFRTIAPPLLRGGLMAIAMIACLALVVLAYWIWSIKDPITQVPIPHGSRENYFERPQLGLIFFIIPWGVASLFWPYAIYKTLTTHLLPLGLSLCLASILGTGGTTPLPRMILGGAFDILTLDRFTFWATILILPFLGLFAETLIFGRLRQTLESYWGRLAHKAVVFGVFASFLVASSATIVLPAIKQVQPKFIDPDPIVDFMTSDEHDRWRYLTLGFGDQFAYLSAQMTAQSVDGNYHSARRLPELTSFAVERLENAKYLGVQGLGSLETFLTYPEKFHLKYVFSNDAFYDPLLHFSGWNRLNRLPNNIVIWEKPDVAPLPQEPKRVSVDPLHATLWGILPPSAISAALVLFLYSCLQRRHTPQILDTRQIVRVKKRFRSDKLALAVVLIGCTGVMSSATMFAVSLYKDANAPLSAAQTVKAYLKDLDFRKIPAAYQKLDPVLKPSEEEFRFQLKWRGGLIASYGKLLAVNLNKQSGTEDLINWNAELTWLTSLGEEREKRTIQTRRHEGAWYIVPTDLRSVQTPVRLQQQKEISWKTIGRRQARFETDLHKDRLDRPRIQVLASELVKTKEGYSVVGEVLNTDVDPAYVTLIATGLDKEGEPVDHSAAGLSTAQRLLPAEVVGFRIDFPKAWSLTEPTDASAEIDQALLEARALVTADNLYRKVALNGLRFSVEGGCLDISGYAVNTGNETASVTKLVFTITDAEGRVADVRAVFVTSNIYPGQSAWFQACLPLAESNIRISTISDDQTVTNGAQAAEPAMSFDPESIRMSLPKMSGYKDVSVHVSSMTFDPIF